MLAFRVEGRVSRKKLKQIDPNVGLYERDEDDPYEKEKEERYNGSAD